MNKPYKCVKCNVEHHYKDEVVFDGDELKTVDEQNPDWSYVICNGCFYKED